jgi:hypothetical protein
MPEAKSLGAPPFSILSDQHQAAQDNNSGPALLPICFQLNINFMKFATTSLFVEVTGSRGFSKILLGSVTMNRNFFYLCSKKCKCRRSVRLQSVGSASQ